MDENIIKIFISSPFKDLQGERCSVKQAIEDANQIFSEYRIALIPVDLQKGARPIPPLDECLNVLAKCNVFIGLLGFRYGSIDSETGISVSELEYDKSCELNLPSLIYFRDRLSLVAMEYRDTDQELINKREKFEKKIEKNHKRETFNTPDELRACVLRDLLHVIFDYEGVKNIISSFDKNEMPCVVEEFFSRLSKKDLQPCIKIALDNKVKAELKRLGLTSIRIKMLKELLGFTSLEFY